MLAQRRVKLDERDFFKRPFDREELASLLASLKLSPRDVLSVKGPAFRELNLNPDELTDNQILDLMVSEPRLIRRPIIIVDGKAIIGFDRERLTAIK